MSPRCLQRPSRPRTRRRPERPALLEGAATRWQERGAVLSGDVGGQVGV